MEDSSATSRKYSSSSSKARCNLSRACCDGIVVSTKRTCLSLSSSRCWQGTSSYTSRSSVGSVAYNGSLRPSVTRFFSRKRCDSPVLPCFEWTSFHSKSSGKGSCRSAQRSTERVGYDRFSSNSPIGSGCLPRSLCSYRSDNSFSNSMVSSSNYIRRSLVLSCF